MSHTDQCPSTLKGEKQKPTKAELRSTRRTLQTAGAAGPAVWRSAEELADTPGFRERLEREFPAGASELFDSSRRTFMKLMGASLALAGAATIPGCRRPDHKILPYSQKVPEEIIPGKPLYYATSMSLPGGGAEGLMVETHEGRPTKIEGNPLHPINRGKSSIWAQAHIMGVYDPDRLKFPVYKNPARGPLEATWDDFRAWAGPELAKFDASGGEGVAVVVEKKTSPSRDAVKGQLLKRWPKAMWVAYDSAEVRSVIEGSTIAFGAPMRELLNLSKAKVIVSLDRDFLETCAEPGGLVHARDFAAGRRVLKAGDPMNRLYVIESGFSITGAQADHRLRLSPGRVAAFAVALAKYLIPKAGLQGAAALQEAIANVSVPAGADLDAKTVSGTTLAEEIAMELLDSANRGAGLVVAGPTQPTAVHALVHAINAAIGAAGSTVSYLPMGQDESADSLAGIKAVAEGMKSGGIKAAFFIGVNPAFDAPRDVQFAEAMTKATTVTLSVPMTETSAASTWALNGAHELESWGDVEAIDGTISPIQPMIAPLYEPAMSELEMLAYLAAADRTARIDGYEIVRAAWKAKAGGGDFERQWRRALHDGVAGAGPKAGAAALNVAAVAASVGALKLGAAPTGTSLEVVFRTARLHDGRFANVGWLQELPEVGTRVVWDNPALVSPATAKALKLMDDIEDPYTEGTYPHARMAKVTVGGKSIEIAVWVLPGMADNTILLTRGYGRTACGRVGDGVGFDVEPLRTGAAPVFAAGATIERAGGTHMIASTQNHWSMESRTSIVRQVDLPWWNKYAAETIKADDPLYATEMTLNFAERLGELSHTPPNVSIYKNPLNESGAGAAAGSAYSKPPQWGMTIDLTTCTGCGACTTACQAENNIAVVGKIEVAKGREMAWIRVDRYFTGDTLEDPVSMLHQPVACVHCENAPCETVCPVNATVHGPEGINYMTYNRCIGTRYCANNCPYKVRRFNFFDYGVTKFNGDYIGKGLIESVLPESGVGGSVTGSAEHNKINPNLIPPRLRKKLDEISRMQKNPDVTVRSRGVMEKCSYCIQRINAAKLECKLNELSGVPDGFFQTACQQACPSEAIVFGDILDPASRVAAMRDNARSYMLLGYLNTRPRTHHMVRVVNPNPRVRAIQEDPFAHGSHGSHGGHGAGDSHGEHGKDAAPKAEGQPGGSHSRNDSFFDRRKLAEDRGYALSLRVLGTGAHA